MFIKNYLLLSLAFVFVFSSCKKDNATKDLFANPFSELNIEENKENLEDEGIKMIREVEALMQSEAIDVSQNFSDLGGTMIADEGSKPIMLAMNLTASMNEDEFDSKEIFYSIKSVSEEPSSLSEEWSDVVGTYSWDFALKDWNFVKGGDEIIVKFPGKEGETTNTAEYRVYNFTYVDIVNPAEGFDFDDFGGQLPTSLNANLKYKNSELMTYTFAGKYQTDGIPTEIKVAFSLVDFVFSYEVKQNANISASATYALKHSEKILIEIHADASGNWSEQNIEDNTETIREVYYTDSEGVEYYTEYDNLYIEKIIKNANAHIQMMNIKIIATVNMAKLGAGIRELEEEYEDSKIDKEYYDKLTVLYNKYAKLAAIYADNGKKIAVVEAYSYLEENEWSSYYSVDFRFVFADDSKADAETYFGEGFASLIDELNLLIVDLNEDFEADITPLEY